MFSVRKMGLKVCASLALLTFLTLTSVAQAASVVRDIRIDGAQRIETATILSYMTINVGDKVDQRALGHALKNLFATGLFADVAVTQEGSTVLVDVVENPLINEIAFEGNDRIGNDELLAEIQMRPRQVFTRTKVQSDITRLYQVYRRSGRFSANVEPKVIRLDQNRVNLIFEIEEGDITKVKSIRFVGNENFDDDVLAGEISTKSSRWYSFFSSNDRYDPDRLAYDQDLLRRFYLSEGYADFHLNSAVAELSKNKENFFITFSVEEGGRYKIGSVNIDSRLKDFDASVLNDIIKIKSGEWYDANAAQETIDALTDELGDLQYAFVNVTPNVSKNREELLIDLTFEINQTPRVFVERINVNGNLRTLDKVIRRELLLSEGDPYNRSKLSRSEQRVNNLNYFENVTFDVQNGSAPDKTVLDIDVTEKSTGELSIGAGFSTNDGPLADIRIRERNLLGKGQDLSLSTTLAGQRTQLDLSFTEPHLFGRDVSAGFDLFHITRDLQDESSFNQRRTGGALRLGYPISEKMRQTLRYRVERNEITDVKDSASFFIRSQEGLRDTSAVSQRLTYDSRNSSVIPTEGWYLWLDAELAGLGGDAKYVSGTTGMSYYHPVTDNITMNIIGETGAISAYGDADVVINERFFLGGSNLRGFERAGVGPRDTSTKDSLGGNFFYRGSMEFSFPIGLPSEYGIKGHAFSDFGSLTDVDGAAGTNFEDTGSIRSSAGVGLSWRSPFGPIRVDLAAPITKEDTDLEEAFRFNFGTRF